ncbi:hypothetical protein [Microbacterium arabinogalactanolyticum]|uniref:hypothetical protein n=1 Tax=Microbacterium arabinogalactanolyticum TaxID=69365 RepID=UPI0025528AAA|nr:hypothetical protein [Microbacterium arabinogalactanolyticum]GLC85750.1 hypothetical protein MIAR_23360 [Microbacterium arabinogalactanolyticum]
MTLATSTVRALGALSAGLLTLGMLSACTPTPEPDPKPTKTALFASDKEAFKAAEETYRAYTDALNNVDTSDPGTFEPMFAYATGDFLAADKKTFSELHAEKLTMIGAMKLAQFKGIESVPPYDEVSAIVCVDVSGTDVVDAAGVSQVAPDRPDMNALTVTFTASPDRLLIAHATRAEDSACTSQ